ncbi:putative PfkB family kinase [Nemania sp. FL0916]|nr:putative PfkB family kinase [Nemania sp. FL0916]
MDQTAANSSRSGPPVFVSLGMLVLDELRFPHLKTVADVPGGSGLYATLGARLFKPGPSAADVGCVIKAGYDIPESTVRLLESWEMTLLLVREADKQCTRGLLEYEDEDLIHNTFNYTTPPLRPAPSDLQTSPLLFAKSFHFLSLPVDLERQVASLLQLRAEQGIHERPLIVWEPAPMGCDSINLASHFSACALVDVISPNRAELRFLLEGKDKSQVEFSQSIVEAQAARFVEAGIGPTQEGLIVVRAGEHGVLILSKTRKAEWLPTYYGKDDSDKVIDATGAGNAFLGAFAVTLQETKDPREAALRGSVASSYALEQFGPPKLTTSPSGEELWNESAVMSRLNNLKTRVARG